MRVLIERQVHQYSVGYVDNLEIPAKGLLLQLLQSIVVYILEGELFRMYRIGLWFVVLCCAEPLGDCQELPLYRDLVGLCF